MPRDARGARVHGSLRVDGLSDPAPARSRHSRTAPRARRRHALSRYRPARPAGDSTDRSPPPRLARVPAALPVQAVAGALRATSGVAQNGAAVRCEEARLERGRDAAVTFCAGAPSHPVLEITVACVAQT